MVCVRVGVAPGRGEDGICPDSSGADRQDLQDRGMLVVRCMVRFGVELCCVVWFGKVWHGMVWYGLVWYGMVWHGTVWYGMVWYGIAGFVGVCGRSLWGAFAACLRVYVC